MALTLYPDPNADSFVTLVDANTYICNLTMHCNTWNALTDDDKERLLRIAYRNIIDNTDSSTYPSPLPLCVGESQSLMAVHDHVNGISTTVQSTANTGAIKKQKAGPVEQEFYDVKSGTIGSSVSIVPDLAKPCLNVLGYSFSSVNGIKQTILGRS